MEIKYSGGDFVLLVFLTSEKLDEGLVAEGGDWCPFYWRLRRAKAKQFVPCRVTGICN